MILLSLSSKAAPHLIYHVGDINGFWAFSQRWFPDSKTHNESHKSDESPVFKGLKRADFTDHLGGTVREFWLFVTVAALANVSPRPINQINNDTWPAMSDRSRVKWYGPHTWKRVWRHFWNIPSKSLESACLLHLPHKIAPFLGNFATNGPLGCTQLWILHVTSFPLLGAGASLT